SRTIGATILSASSGFEFAMESPDYRNGLFTASILTALRGQRADANNDGDVTAGELVSYVKNEVSKITEGGQHPEARFTNLAIEFTIASKLPGGSPRASPEQLLAQFHEWSGGVLDTQGNPRLLSCFAPKVSYFGKQSTHADISADNAEYNQRFPTRSMKVEVIHSRQDSEDGRACKIRYRNSYRVSWSVPVPGRPGVSETKNKNGTQEMEAEMVLQDGEWKFAGLRLVKQ
ncbi:MAG: hypothetical protein JNG86_10955, partial [Verrucomicrobiaceae bacterium]|nr:hypothetical protein [Verrucomicrobiaceae bacterium]